MLMGPALQPLTRGQARAMTRCEHDGLARTLRQLATVAPKVILLVVRLRVLNLILRNMALLVRVRRVGRVMGCSARLLGVAVRVSSYVVTVGDCGLRTMMMK